MGALEQAYREMDGNTAALLLHEREEFEQDQKQAGIDSRTKELIEDHTADSDDMIVDLLTNDPEKAHELLSMLLSSGNGLPNPLEIARSRNWFYNEFIPEQCRKQAEEELNDGK